MPSITLDASLLDALRDRLDALCRHRSGGDGDRGAVVSVWWGDLEGRVLFERDAHRGHYAASTMKLPLVLAAQRLVVRGELDPAAAVEVHNRFASVADGSSFAMDEDDDQDPETWAALGGTRTVAQLVEHAITRSGNLATNLLLDRVGLPEVAAVLAAAGCSPRTVVGRGIEDAVAREAGVTNTVTAGDLGILMAAVGRRDPALGGAAVCDPVEQVLARQLHRDQVPAGLPDGTPTASKSGWVTGVSHDVCLVRPVGEPPSVISVCTTIDLAEEEAAALVASVARELWSARTGESA
ncbi:MAG: serine hydrolase [Terracoccus sp.]